VNKPRIVIVHGIHTNDRAPWMDFLVEAFSARGWDACAWTYGYAYALLTRLQNPSRARVLYDLIEPGDVVLGHSNGACLAWMAAKLGAPIGGAILINPALDTDKVMAPHVPWVNLYPNVYDDAVPFAGLFIGHPWGAQGREGLSVPDIRYKTTWTSTRRNDAPAVRGHSAVLAADVLPAWSQVFINHAESRRRL